MLLSCQDFLNRRLSYIESGSKKAPGFSKRRNIEFMLLIILDEATKEFVIFIIKDRNHIEITHYSFNAL